MKYALVDFLSVDDDHSVKVIFFLLASSEKPCLFDFIVRNEALASGKKLMAIKLMAVKVVFHPLAIVRQPLPMFNLIYRAGHPVSRKVSKIMFWEVPLADWLIL